MKKQEQFKTLSNIKKMRELRGYNQKHMAGKMGIGQTTYSKLENGEMTLTDEYFKKIADTLGTTVEAIKQFDEKMLFHISHQQGGTVISLHNTMDEMLKAFHELTQPYKDRIKQLEEEVLFLRNLIEKN